MSFLVKFKDYDVKEKIPFSLIDRLLRRLRVSKDIADHEVLTIF